MEGRSSTKPSSSPVGWARALPLLAAACVSHVAQAQAPAVTPATRDTVPTFVTLGSAEDVRRTLRPLAGDSSAATGRLFRSPSSELGPVAPRARLRLRAVLPGVRSVYNSALPYNVNEGNLWAGRGENLLVRAGEIVEFGRARVVFVPELAYSQNRPFDVFAGGTGYSAYASWLHTGPLAGYAHADLPMRFGDLSSLTATLGQSSVTVRAAAVELGATTEAEWWGPAQRVAIVMSNAAPSIPRAFVRTARPVRTRLGDVEARVFAGTLTESLFYDAAQSNGFRSLVGAAVSLAPAITRGLTLGVERTVDRPESGAGQAVGRWTDVLRFWTPASRLTASGAPAETARADQLFAFTARQVFPGAGVDVYAEWARQSPPRSLREFLLAPQESQGYTLGLQWLSRPLDYGPSGALLRGARVRLGAEASDVEQSVAFLGRAARDFYSGAAAPQGYTQRGRVIGAFTGPGSSSQWLSADLRQDAWQLESFAGRVRWENDALYRLEAPTFFRHDVSLLGGVRVTSRRAPLYNVRAELTYQTRYNYMFQNANAVPGHTRTVNVHNVTLGLSLEPR